MINYTNHLISVGKDYINKHKSKELLYAFAGGSVGRGDADEYSDLDLNLFLSKDVNEGKNIRFNSEIIQVETRSLIDINEVKNNPWDYRFLLEVKNLYDPNNILANLLDQAVEYFHSYEGRNKMKLQAKDTIKDRLNWLNSSVHKKEMITARIVAHSALLDSAFYYAYFVNNSLSTGGLIKAVQNMSSFNEFIKYIHIGDYDENEMLKYIRDYRSYLRSIYGDNFMLQSVQDELVQRKAKRHIKNKELDILFLQLSSEVLFCYLSIPNQVSFEEHYNQLPIELQRSLEKLGYYPYTIEQIENIKTIVNDIVNEVDKRIVVFNN